MKKNNFDLFKEYFEGEEKVIDSFNNSDFSAYDFISFGT